MQFLSHVIHVLPCKCSLLRRSKPTNRIKAWRSLRPPPKCLFFLFISYQITPGEFSSKRMQRQSPEDHIISSPGQRIRLGFSTLYFWRKKFSEGSGWEKAKLSLFKWPSLQSKLTLLDAAKQKPSIPRPGLLQSWPVLGGSQCTAGPRSGLWLTRGTIIDVCSKFQSTQLRCLKQSD